MRPNWPLGARDVKANSARDITENYGQAGHMSRLKEIMDARGVSAAELARTCKVDPSTISKLVGAKREMRRHWADMFAPALSVRPDDLLASQGAPIPALEYALGSDVQPLQIRLPMETKRLPLAATTEVLGTVSCGSDGQFIVNLATGHPLDYVDTPAKLVGVPGIFALFVAGDSMVGVWEPGDVVYVSKNRPVTPGAYAVVLVEEGPGEQPAAYLKEYVRGDNYSVVFRQYNPAVERTIDRARVKELWRALHWREWAQ